MKAIILNYTCDCVEVAVIPEEVIKDAEDAPSYSERIEKYLSKELGYYLDSINYLLSNEDRVPVYDTEHEEPITLI